MGERSVLPPEQYVASLARKRMTASAYFRDVAGRVLLVDPVYKQPWDLPDPTADFIPLFTGVDLIEPGLVPTSQWRPGSDREASAPSVAWAGVARKRRPVTPAGTYNPGHHARPAATASRSPKRI